MIKFNKSINLNELKERDFEKARAIFDNESDCIEELSFLSGDILTVIEKNVNGLAGWWLCFFKDKVGIAPGNRLKIITPSVFNLKHENSKENSKLVDDSFLKIKNKDLASGRDSSLSLISTGSSCISDRSSLSTELQNEANFSNSKGNVSLNIQLGLLEKLNQDRDSLLEDYSIPRHQKNSISNSSLVLNTIQEMNCLPKSKNCNGTDSPILYDTPKKCSSKSELVYDVPQNLENLKSDVKKWNFQNNKKEKFCESNPTYDVPSCQLFFPIKNVSTSSSNDQMRLPPRDSPINKRPLPPPPLIYSSSITNNNLIIQNNNYNKLQHVLQQQKLHQQIRSFDHNQLRHYTTTYSSSQPNTHSPFHQSSGEEGDVLLVDFYASQIDHHLRLVSKACIDFNHLMNCKSDLPSPKDFVLRSKFVILSAHGLIYLADAISRNLAFPQAFSNISEAANELCSVLKMAVNSTKEAALRHQDPAKIHHMQKCLQRVYIFSDKFAKVIKSFKL